MDLSELTASVVTADAPVVTTAETVAATSDVVNVPREDSVVIIIAWAVLTLGTNTTAVTPRIRRGATAAGTAIGDANTEQIKTAAASNEPFFKFATEQIQGAGNVQYSLTLQQTGASANGTILEAGILVLVV